MLPTPSVADIVDLERYPLDRPGDEDVVGLVGQLRATLAADGVVLLPGFVRPEAIAAMAVETAELASRSLWAEFHATPYQHPPDDTLPAGDPRRYDGHSVASALIEQDIPATSPLRLLYEWPGLRQLVQEVLGLTSLSPIGYPEFALNYVTRRSGEGQDWHFDATEFTVLLSIEQSTGGGEFQCVPNIRHDGDERYDEVARVLSGEDTDRVEVYPLPPGTLMIFRGRDSIHRVTGVEGDRPRSIALFRWESEPGASGESFEQSMSLLRNMRALTVSGR